MNELAVATSREAIELLQALMVKLPQLTDIITEHVFIAGMYLRILARPADCLIIGKVHKREHLYIVLRGEVEVRAAGLPPCRLRAGQSIASPVGTKRAVYAITDAICMTAHPWDGPKDLALIEHEFIEPDDTALFDEHNKPKLELLP